MKPAHDYPQLANIPDEFDRHSGSAIERLVFNNRLAILLLCLVLTLVLGVLSWQVRLNASFEKTIPASHPYIVNYLAHKNALTGLFPNAVRIAVATSEGTIFTAEYMERLRRLSDELFLLPGVDRPFMKSLWTPSTIWLGVTEDGLDGGPVIPDDYDGSAASLEALRNNVARSGEIGQLVAPDLRSSVIFVPLLDINTETGQPLDYGELSRRLEDLRTRYENDGLQLHITGFAKVVGDLIQGLLAIFAFFAAAVLIIASVLYVYTRCVRSTLIVVSCSLIAVIWQLGLLAALGYALNPYSILVPFLVFAIGMSHGAQKMNGIMQDIGRGATRLVAARLTFRRLFLAGLTALLCDAVGFAVLMLIDIAVIRELALIASLGVAILIFTNLILLPILLSYVGVSAVAAARSLSAEVGDGERQMLWRVLDVFTTRKPAMLAIGLAAVLGGLGYFVSLHLKIGDIDPGAPELRPDSRYNRDAAFLNKNYGASSDVFAVMIKTPPNGCAEYAVQSRVDALAWRLQALPGVESTRSLPGISRNVIVGLNEGNLKWYELLPTQSLLNTVTNRVPPEVFNPMCDMLALFAYLKDHKADTLSTVANEVAAFAQDNSAPDGEFMLAAGTAGIEAATNEVVAQASREMLFWVYGAVTLLCLITFRSWRAVLCAILPLMLTSILAEALMVALGMGVKVATLPVIALGVGIGVDYALYILSVTLAELRAGRSLSDAYYRALIFTGKVVMLTGVTLAVAVVTWVASPIKFQADMGILLAFMFVWNMLGALVLLPALACFLFRGTPDHLAAQASAPDIDTVANPPQDHRSKRHAQAL